MKFKATATVTISRTMTFDLEGDFETKEKALHEMRYGDYKNPNITGKDIINNECTEDESWQIENVEIDQEIPNHEHDCSSCELLGDCTDENVKYDLYYCKDSPGGLGGSLIARYGSEGSEYLSMPFNVLRDNLNSFHKGYALRIAFERLWDKAEANMMGQ